MQESIKFINKKIKLLAILGLSVTAVVSLGSIYFPTILNSQPLPQGKPITEPFFFKEIEGPPTRLIKDYLKIFDLPPPADLSKFSPDSELGGMRMSRVRLLVDFQDTASVSQVNALLREINGRVVGVFDAIEIFYIEIPDSQDLSRIKHAADVLNQKQAIVENVSTDVMMGSVKPR